jgi:uncharacterized protein (DUF2267 family)
MKRKQNFELCVNFQTLYEDMTPEEADRFHAAFGYILSAMTLTNGQTVRNLIWLNDNFMEVWNSNPPNEVLGVCIKQAQDMVKVYK